MRSPTTAAELFVARHRREELDARVIAPLVHHEQSIGRGLREPVGRGEIVGERLLDEDRDAALERALSTTSACVSVGVATTIPSTLGQVVRGLDDVRGASLARGRSAVL